MLNDVVGRANDYSFIDLCKDFAYGLRKDRELVSVVIPHYNAHELLRGCVKSLAHQTFNPSRIEIVIADDGSEMLPDVSDLQRPFKDIQVVAQENMGFRISAARNMGVRACTGQYVVILDCDMRAAPTLIEEHVRALSVSSRVISVGFRKDNATLDEDWREAIPYEDLDWRYERFMKEGNTWARFANDQFRLVSGGNLAAHRGLFLDIPFDESYVQWGGEDNEWGYRCINEGMYIYPNLKASARHVRPATAHTLPDEDKKNIRDFTERKCPTLSATSIRRSEFERPYVSVWVTSFNKEDFLTEAIRSTKGIKFSHEIVVVDDGSTDNSLDILEGLKGEFPHMRVISMEHKGAFYAYERALIECQGDLLLQLDADDVLVCEGVNRMITHMYQNSDGMAFGNFQRVGEQLEDIGAPVRSPMHSNRHQKLLEGMRILCPRLIRRRDLSRMPPRAPRLAAIDYALYSKVHLVASSAQIDSLGYLYRQHADSISNTLRDIQFEEPNRVMEENLNLLQGDFEYAMTQVRQRLRTYSFTRGHALYLNHLGVKDIRVLKYLEQRLIGTSHPQTYLD